MINIETIDKKCAKIYNFSSLKTKCSIKWSNKMNLNYYIDYIIKKHRGQTRKHGIPYYIHPLTVRNILERKGFSIEYQIAGLFHDLIEDTDTTYEDIQKISNTRIADVVKLVSKEKGYEMAEYIKRIKENDMARMVKLADRYHNLLETHLASEKFQERYIKDTETWYLDLAKDTVFEEDIKSELAKLKNLKKQNEKELIF